MSVAKSIFDNPDTDENSGSTRGDDLVGRFRSGRLRNGRPMALTTWLVTSGDPVVVDSAAEMLGGKRVRRETESDDVWEVETDADAVPVLLDDPGAFRSGFTWWGAKGKIHECDGEITTEGKPCHMAGATITERKEAAKNGSGCQPSLALYFRLAADPVGKFSYYTGSWGLLRDAASIERELAKVGGPAEATLSIEHVEWTTKTGEDRSYYRPRITNIRPA